MLWFEISVLGEHFFLTLDTHNVLPSGKYVNKSLSFITKFLSNGKDNCSPPMVIKLETKLDNYLQQDLSNSIKIWSPVLLTHCNPNIIILVHFPSVHIKNISTTEKDATNFPTEIFFRQPQWWSYFSRAQNLSSGSLLPPWAFILSENCFTSQE